MDFKLGTASFIVCLFPAASTSSSLLATNPQVYLYVCRFLFHSSTRILAKSARAFYLFFCLLPCLWALRSRCALDAALLAVLCGLFIFSPSEPLFVVFLGRSVNILASITIRPVGIKKRVLSGLGHLATDDRLSR